MSEQKHSKEPLRVVYDHGYIDILGADDSFVAETFGSDLRPTKELADDNARRIVACVNACEGIPIESLEAFNDWSKAGVASAKTYRDQRDELLAALKGITEMYVRLINSGDCGNWDPEEDKEVIASRAAIAKAEGKV
jgi:hypothetical protein